MSLTAPPKPTLWQRWRIVAYGLLGLVIFILLFWAYTKYEEHLEWKRIDELLAAQDKKHPHWRWHEFLPKPLQPGEPNGALRFIDVGKQLTEEMLTQPDYPDEDSLPFQMFTREWLTTINRDSVRESGKMVRDKCKHLESKLPSLVELQPGCPPFNSDRPSAADFFGVEKSQFQLVRDVASHNRARRWLLRLFLCHLDDGNGDQAVQAWRALLSFDYCQVPGIMAGLSLSKFVAYHRDFYVCYKMLAQTVPTEPSLLQLQHTVAEWHTHLVTMDDVNFDRAWAIQFLLEVKEQSKGAFLTGLHQLYAKPPEWMSEEWQKRMTKLGIGSPSLPYMYRMEIMTHLRVFDSFEQQLLAGKPFLKLDLFDDDEACAGRHFAIYFWPRWRAMLTNLQGLHQHLLCLEALVAAERFRLKTGDYPRQWNNLVPAYLKAIPQSGDKPYTLKPVPEGLVIYLAHEKDHGGKVLKVFDEEGLKFVGETDNGLMIFYPKYRRQPPPPVKPKPKDE